MKIRAVALVIVAAIAVTAMVLAQQHVTVDNPPQNVTSRVAPSSGVPWYFLLKGPSGPPAQVTGGALNVNVINPPATWDPCSGPVKLNVPISTTANVQLATGVNGKLLRVCSIFLLSTSAESVSLVEGTGSVCATSTLAVIGSTTAANGIDAAANGGFTLGNGQGTVAHSNVQGNSLCLFLSGSTKVAGNAEIAY